MLPRHRPKNFRSLLKTFTNSELRILRRTSSVQNDSVKKPEYPPILDVSSTAVKKREKQALHDKYRKLNTVEEKLLALNFPRYWGWEPVILNEGELPYNILPFVKYVTRTKFNETLDFPQVASSISDFDPKDLVNVIKSQIQEALIFETFERRHKCESEFRVNNDIIDDIKVKNLKLKSILNQINRILTVNLSSYAPHLIDVEVDYNPRLEAFWKVGGFKRSEEEHRIRTEKLERDDIPFEWKEEDGLELEHWFQYFGKPILQLRSPLPLEPISNDVVSEDDITNLTSLEARYSPAFLGFEKKRRHGTTIPGFWPGSGANEFGLLSFHSCNHLLGRPPHFGVDDHNEAVHAQAVLAGYAWLHGQASYQGFSTFNDITYPLVSQSVITDGQYFSFYTYQLNTMLMHKEYLDSNKKCNFCYGSPRLKLYDSIKGQDFIGWNDDVILKLISMYLNKTSNRDYNLKPYLNENEKYVSEITDIGERRAWLHKEFRFMYSNRPRHLLPYEIFDWEWIYKIKFETRPMEARKRPFEFWRHPLTDRNYKDYQPRYIPKKLKNPDKPKQKYENTYFPDAF